MIVLHTLACISPSITSSVFIPIHVPGEIWLRQNEETFFFSFVFVLQSNPHDECSDTAVFGTLEAKAFL